MMKNIKLIILLIPFVFLKSNLQAQDGIDTALFKHYKVKKMWVFVKLPILPNRTLDDSCMAEVYKMDTVSNIVYQNNLMSCYGWSNSNESFNTYDSLNRMKTSKTITENTETYIKYFYNSKHAIIKIVQSRPTSGDSMILLNKYNYNKKGLVKEMVVYEIYEKDTSKHIIQYEYDKADNVKVCSTFDKDRQLMKKETFDITPISKKLLEFSTETLFPKASFTKGWNYYNFDAQLSRTQYSNNTWTEFIYKDNGLLDQTLSYNMEGKLNAWKRFYYEFYEGIK